MLSLTIARLSAMDQVIICYGNHASQVMAAIASGADVCGCGHEIGISVQLRIKDAEGFQVEAIAPLPAHMRKAIQMLFRSLPEDLEAQLPRLAQLSDFSTPQSLQDALEKARHSLQSRAHENAAPKRSAVLPRVAHVNLPADPKFEHLAVRSRDENERDTSASDDEDDSSNSDMDSDGEVIDRKARWTSARKKEAKEKRRVLKKARRALQKERREQILAQTPLSWDK